MAQGRETQAEEETERARDRQREGERNSMGQRQRVGERDRLRECGGEAERATPHIQRGEKTEVGRERERWKQRKTDEGKCSDKHTGRNRAEK